MTPRNDRTGTLRSEAPKRPQQNGRRGRPIFLLLSLLLLSLNALLASCGGGPTVATPTGRTLYLATTSGIYGFSIMSDGTLSAVSASPLATGSYKQIAATTGSSPLLIGANGGTSLTTWNISGGGLGSKGTISVSCISQATGVAVTSDNNYILVVDGGATTNNIASLPITGGTCHTANTSSSVYPVQPALDCSLPASQNCILFLTISSNSTLNPAPTTPVEYTYTEGSAVSTSTPLTSPLCTSPACPLGVAFNPNTLYFYATFNGDSPSLQSFAPQTATAAQSTSFPTPNLTFPCIDALGGVAYIPTSNGYVYSVSTASGGGLGAPATVLSPQTFGSTLNISSCAVGGS